MDEIWNRIEAWLAVNTPVTVAGFNPPATEDEIAETERLLGVNFPDDVRTSYLRHDGEAGNAPGMLQGWEWLSMARIRDEWTVWKGLLDDFEEYDSDADGLTVRKEWWNPAWIPLTYDGAGNHQCLDLAPGPEGVSGQIISFWHDDGERSVLASSFQDWLADFAEGLETGGFVVSEKYGFIVRREDAEK